jgi:hypothetical protein
LLGWIWGIWTRSSTSRSLGLRFLDGGFMRCHHCNISSRIVAQLAVCLRHNIVPLSVVASCSDCEGGSDSGVKCLEIVVGDEDDELQAAFE